MKIKATVIIKSGYLGKEKSKEEIFAGFKTYILKSMGFSLNNCIDVKIKVEEDTDA